MADLVKYDLQVYELISVVVINSRSFSIQMYIVLTNYDLTMSFPWKLLILIGLFELQYLLGWDDGYDWKCGDWWLSASSYGSSE